MATWLDGVPDEQLADLLQLAALTEFPVPPHESSAVLDTREFAATTQFVVNAEVVLSAKEEEGLLTLRLADRVLTLPAQLAAVIADLLARERFSIAELAAAGAPPLEDGVLRQLWREGLISAADSGLEGGRSAWN
jgi:hypothetical protein